MEAPIFFNRDLSWIDFNERVLEEGLRPDLPPLERFRFLSIVASNFDEFFMVRIAALKVSLKASCKMQQDRSMAKSGGVCAGSADGGKFSGFADPSGLSPQAVLSAAAEKSRSITSRLYVCLAHEVFPALAKGGLCFVRPSDYSVENAAFLESFFMNEIYPVLTPLRIEEGQRLPSIGSSCLYAAFLLAPENVGDFSALGGGDALFTEENAKSGAEPDTKASVAAGGEPGVAVCAAASAGSGNSPGNPSAGAFQESPSAVISIIKIPPAIDRIIWLPSKEGAEGKRFALLEDAVRVWGHRLYPGFQVREDMLFKINRDADFSVDEKRDEDFIEAMTEVIEGRETSMAVRMVFSSGSAFLREKLAAYLDLSADDLYEVSGPLQLGDLFGLVSVQGFDHLRERPWKTYQHPGFITEGEASDETIWDKIRSGDALFHFPYQSFDPVLNFFQIAALDPDVVAIKTTLYRTSGDSPIVRALEQAALNGKQVTAVVELKARFDEERNISWANRLEKAGVIVIYGLSRLKVHVKVSIVMRREKGRVVRYVHLSTGNYNDKTAKLYEDLSLFTANEEIAFDAGILFNMLTGYSMIQAMSRLEIAPVGLKRRLLSLIEREAARSNQDYPGRILAKMNSLADTDMIAALYRASQAGVKIDLCVRGICMLVPGIPGLSENIRVRSVIGHYLEHSRIFYFANGGVEEIFLSSADWMPRNLERRVELMFPVLQEDIRQEVLSILESYFKDNCQARILSQDGSWTRLALHSDERPFTAQSWAADQARKAAEKPLSVREEFVVRRGQEL